MNRYRSMRASDADREAIVSRLREAAGEGRLEPEELEDRVGAALRARTYGELALLISDLPGDSRWPARPRQVPPAVAGLVIVGVVAAAVAAVVLIMALVLAAAAWWALWVAFWVVCCGARGRLVPARRRTARARRLHRTRPAGLF